MNKSTKLPDESYLSSPDMDALARMNTELLSELWILRDRVLVLEHLLAEAGVLGHRQIDQYQPPAALEAALTRDRDRMVARVVGAGLRRELSIEAIKAAEQEPE